MNHIKILTHVAFVSSSLALLLLLLCPNAVTANEAVRLQLKWPHHFQFVGYYAAKEKGYYGAAGMNVEIIPNKPGENPVQKVLAGNAEFGVGTSDLLLRRERGAPVVALAVIFQHSPLPTVSIKRGGKHAIEPDYTELQTYLLTEGFSPDKIPGLIRRFRNEDLRAGTLDAPPAGHLDDPSALKREGQMHPVYSHRSAGIDFYGDNLFTTESQIKLNPKMVRAFREASLKGWEYAMQHQEEMVQLVHTKYNPQYSIEHLRFQARQMEPLLEASLVQIGHMNPARWRHVADTYARMGMMRPDFNLKGFIYDPVPPPQNLTWLYHGLATALALMLAATLIAVRFSRLSTALSKTISDHKRVGDALRESESLYRSILNASPDGIIITDTEGTTKMVSPAGVTMFGYKREEELLGNKLIELIFTEDRERAKTEMQLMLQGSFSGVGDYRAILADGSTLDIETNGQVIRNEKEQPTSMVFVIRDITERKQAGNACLQAMGEVVCAIAHQWRQPLATLGMIIQRAHAVGTMQVLTADYLDEFKANAMRQIKYMSDTIEEFRGFYRPEKEKAPFSPLNCINDSIRLFEPQFTSSSIAVNVSCLDCEGKLVEGLPNEFKQVVLNLLGNARDAILEKRKHKGEPGHGYISVQITASKEKTICIDFTDNGCGIKPDIAPHILDPYFTTKEKSGGTGLGLYMSRTIVEKSLGGSLCLIQCNEGATFRIELPLRKTS
ncbi:MAG: ABC transporter substrate-binding protein [Desulfuromonadaceae bacterium]|nr:ABC transporter substrate-binding protein [Desulfuromonadaceae bacterium]